MPSSAADAARALGALPRVQPRRIPAYHARPAPGIRSRAPSPTPSARLAPLEDGRVRRGRLPCQGASAAILAPTARMWEPPARVSVDSVRQEPGAGWLVLTRMRLARHVRRAPGAAPPELPVRPSASAVRRGPGATPRERALPRPAGPVVQGFISRQRVRPPRATASSASQAATTAASVQRGAAGARRVLGAPLVVQLRAMFAPTAPGPTFRARSMPTIALAAAARTTARQEQPPV